MTIIKIRFTIFCSYQGGIETVETINDGLWHWYDVMGDLRGQGGLAGVTIDPLSVSTHGCGGQTEKGTIFNITWLKNKFLLVSVTDEEQALIESFARVVEYRPFCRYIDDNGLLTFEWGKENPEGRFAKLQGKTKLQRVQ